MQYVLLFLFWLLNPVYAFAEDGSSPWIFPNHSDYPQIKKTGEQFSDFIPPGWKVLGKAAGDLNGDDRTDIVLVLKNTSSKFKQKNSGLGDKVFDTNPRMLVILFNDPKTGGYQLAQSSRTIIPIPESPTMEEPFEKISIHNGILQLAFTVWYSAGSWSSSNASYKFRWQDNRFVLIGADKTEIERNSGKKTDFSYNFLTGKEQIVTGNIESKKSTSKWQILRTKGLRHLEDFKQLYEWQVGPDEYL